MLLPFKIIFFLLLNTIDVLNSDMTSDINIHKQGMNFVPLSWLELLGTYSSISAELSCSLLCHQNPRCRTFVFNPPTCRLYEGALSTGQLITASSTSSIVGEILYDRIDLSSSYNQTCDHCYPDRYLVCQNNRCLCPSGTYWNGINKCLNQLYLDASCEEDDWCRQDINMTCRCNKCQCPAETFWHNQSCIQQFAAGTPCNTSNQCRNDQQMVCSRINKTCIAGTPGLITVLNATVPAAFSIYNISLYQSPYEWWKAFDNQTNTFWNSMASLVKNYIYLILDGEYLLTSFQLTAYSDIIHDPKIVEYYLDENATCLSDNFTFPQVPNGSTKYVFPMTSFNYQVQPIVAQRILIGIIRWTEYQICIPELALYGIPY